VGEREARIVERAVWEAVERTVEVSWINCGSSQVIRSLIEFDIAFRSAAKV
jgi:hypothetical protein